MGKGEKWVNEMKMQVKNADENQRKNVSHGHKQKYGKFDGTG